MQSGGKVSNQASSLKGDNQANDVPLCCSDGTDPQLSTKKEKIIIGTADAGDTLALEPILAPGNPLPYAGKGDAARASSVTGTCMQPTVAWECVQDVGATGSGIAGDSTGTALVGVASVPALWAACAAHSDGRGVVVEIPLSGVAESHDVLVKAVSCSSGSSDEFDEAQEDLLGEEDWLDDTHALLTHTEGES